MRIILLLCCLPFLALGQQTKTTEKSYDIPASKEVRMDLKFGQIIKVTRTTGNKIILKTNFTYSNEDMLEIYEEEVRTGQVLDIETGFKKWDRSYSRDNQCWSCDNPKCFCLEFDYEILVPTSVKLEVETISGDIEVADWNGELRAKSISGFIDVAINPREKRDISLKSVTGEVYTDLGLRLDEGSTAYSKKMNTSLNGGGKKVRLSTVSGDIFLRKKS